MEFNAILSNEIWYEIVAFYPLKNIVNSAQYSVENAIELFKKDRFVKLKKWRNRLLQDLLTLWGQSLSYRERRDQIPKSSLIWEQINAEYEKCRENVSQKMYQLFKINQLPWPYQKCGVGVSHTRMCRNFF
jgi:hypothetical protein